MCVMSMILDHYQDEWQRKKIVPRLPYDPYTPSYPPYTPPPTITPAEIEEFKSLLERAREYDKRTGQPDCELDEKRETLRKLAEQLGVQIEFV